MSSGFVEVPVEMTLRRRPATQRRWKTLIKTECKVSYDPENDELAFGLIGEDEVYVISMTADAWSSLYGVVFDQIPNEWGQGDDD